MSDFNSLKSHFLIAMPSLQDPNFVQGVALLCEHNEEGAMGIVINHPLSITTSELFDHLEIPLETSLMEQEGSVMAGGPVQTDRGFVVHRTGQLWQSSLDISEQITITTSPDILVSMAQNGGPAEAFIALGYAGWGPGQLEQEITDNSWLCVPADADIIFNTKVEERWQKAIELLGISSAQISTTVGHA
ncbi:YqgE/AlgH family protein [Pleionea sp. CnH1-48]|uniref:YqgE/AlgH family protein n=1 Tax=Pleionea sp. CnH1-48 TaxID=2954494 RepID=UPI002096F432|nr:YqgE/AlgH family protein [Pleionea sp. CnH1-48]MCO7225259.1 YqgE/AlgH family protein [Pleionea sp. CnH1-48]